VSASTASPSDGADAVERLCPKCERTTRGAEVVCASCGVRLVDVSPAGGLVGAVVDGRFEIRALLGEGGMGTVYRAWQRSVDREVAIKVIDRTRVRDAMTVRRFLREAKLASQLSHPNTVGVIDFGQAEDGRLFIAMELVRGRTLARVLAEDGAMSVARVAGVGIQLCDALEAAHGLAIVHRDLKPANVILVDDPAGRDRIKVLDFGLAKSLVGDDTEATESGDVVGTPRYLAPELVSGKAVTAQSDLYAVGVMLGELALGRRLFEGTQIAELLWQKLHEAVVPADMPGALAPIIARLIDPEPSRRPASAAALRAELAAIAGDPGASGVSSAGRAMGAGGAGGASGAGAGIDVTPSSAETGRVGGAFVDPTPFTAPVKFSATPRVVAAHEPAIAMTKRPRGRRTVAAIALGALAIAAIAGARVMTRASNNDDDGATTAPGATVPVKVPAAAPATATPAPAPPAPAPLAIPPAPPLPTPARDDSTAPPARASRPHRHHDAATTKPAATKPAATTPRTPKPPEDLPF
jgi:eukaryotic-like serine/threonine-protein kinase